MDAPNAIDLSLRSLFSLSQMSSGVLTGTDASRRRRCATGSTTVKTGPMNWTVQDGWRAAISAVTTTLAASQRPSCVMERETALTGQMKKSVVGVVHI